MTKVFTVIVALVAWFGFAGPACVSAKSSLLAYGWPVATLGGALWAAKAIAEAEGTARANELKQKTLTAELVRMAWIEKWDGHLPQVSSEAIPMVTIK